MIDFINDRLAGLDGPDDDRRSGSARLPTPGEAAIDLAVEQVRACREIADGVHIMPLGLDEAVPGIIERAGVTV